MKIYAVVNMYDVDGIWISEGESEDILFSSLELAEAHKTKVDALEFAEHSAREAQRYERWTKKNKAKLILEANKFEGVEEIFPYNHGPFSFADWHSRNQIIVLEVQE